MVYSFRKLFSEIEYLIIELMDHANTCLGPRRNLIGNHQTPARDPRETCPGLAWDLAGTRLRLDRDPLGT